MAAQSTSDRVAKSARLLSNTARAALADVYDVSVAISKPEDTAGDHAALDRDLMDQADFNDMAATYLAGANVRRHAKDGSTLTLHAS